MTAREFLNQAYKLDQRINSKLEQLRTLSELALKVTGAVSGMPHTTDRSASGPADTIVKIIDLQEEINRQVDELVDTKREIMHVIRSVEDTDCRLLLEMRYLCYRSWEQIAVDMGYCIDNVFRVHRKALRFVDAVLESVQ